MPRRMSALAVAALFGLPALMLWVAPASAQEDLPWRRGSGGGYDSGGYQQQQPGDAYGSDPRYDSRGYPQNQPQNEAYRPPRAVDNSGGYQGGGGQYRPDSYSSNNSGRYGQPYTPGPDSQAGYDRRYDPAPYNGPGDGRGYPGDEGYSSSEITQAGHRFFGSVSKGLASVIEYAFKQQGRPNGYILGQDAGGAFVAGLRYGEGTLFTRDAGSRKVYWQGPSIGYDAGAEGSKVMVLVYGLRDPEDVYQRFGGVDGSAYVVGGAGLTFQKNGDVVMAPIRSGVGLRLGANVGYLKYTRQPTWNPF